MLKQISVRNWRAFDAAEVALRPGVNVLLGPNGAGKTSLLEAVAFGLAGAPSTLSDVRLMARAAGQPVDVAVALDLDGTIWEISRGLGPTHRRGSDLLRARGAVAAEGGERVTAMLAQVLGVPCDFFLRVLYMPEGDVYRFLTDPPLGAIDAHLRRLLGLEQIALVEQAVARVKRELTHERANLTSLAEQVAGRDAVLVEGRARWGGDPAAHQRALETERERRTAAHSEAVRARRRLDDEAHRLARAIAEVERLDADQTELGAAADAEAAFAAAREECARLQRALQQVEADYAAAAAEQRAHADQGRVLAARPAADFVADDPAARERRAEHEAAIWQLDNALAELAADRRALAERQRTLAARAPGDLVAEDPDLQEQQAARDTALRDADAAIVAINTERAALDESTAFLQAHAPGATAEAVCPVCRQPLPEALRQRLLAENAERGRVLTDRLAELQAQREALLAAGQAAADALKRRLLADVAARATALAEQEARLQAERQEHRAALDAEADALRQDALRAHAARGDALTARLTRLQAERQARAAALEQAERREGEARERRRRIHDLAERRQVLLPDGTTLDALRAEQARLSAEQVAAREREEALAREVDAVGRELTALRGYLEIAAMEGRAAALARTRAALARRELLADLFATATTATLARLRESALAETYGAVEAAWAEFSGWTGVRLEQQAKGRLAVHRADRRLDLAQLSGGERAAFLALLHAHLGRQFGRGGFLLLDEPLEHLDAANGRRLLEHLARACTDGLLNQVVIATVEAEVVDAALNHGGAHIVRLPLDRDGHA